MSASDTANRPFHWLAGCVSYKSLGYWLCVLAIVICWLELSSHKCTDLCHDIKRLALCVLHGFLRHCSNAVLQCTNMVLYNNVNPCNFFQKHWPGHLHIWQTRAKGRLKLRNCTMPNSLMVWHHPPLLTVNSRENDIKQAIEQSDLVVHCSYPFLYWVF